MVEDLQHICIQELYDFKQVSESEIDKLLNEVQRLPEWYVRAGSEIMCEEWLVAAIKRNLPTNIPMDLSMELRNLTIVDAIRHAVDAYRHDHRTGLPRGVPGGMLVMAEQFAESEPASTPLQLHCSDQQCEHS